ncbi:uncharacterized protein PODANS_2_8670 [Podospora anserina S mat+]|uniref:Podospora anserina S mat+ genomic DNA chromosome 2, supercontig 2 n=1 Tax=Podospora anserina (strain S / ATCC MYA-4624 / DSM 980 / FGSC 10383) TaxID=515849 RepID=B2B6S2_PODAN|nr:uncharacterized protein PODANS_2_8670 [Podospora anserina S mat+]CAP73499.1 unnamed protein product [Podospora anserina S mat+]CDP25901.1 Putative protein similar to IES1 of Saccharomyces cerevisiae [Podospora anserina S mat+]
MAASPSSAVAMSEVDASSPLPQHHHHMEKSFMTVVTDDDGDTKMATATPEPTETQPRGKKRARDDGQNGNSIIGKVRHLKKNDGEPLWREDIQYDFLKAVFNNEDKVFTNSYEPQRLGKQCFADLYIDTMARSSKTSKVLRDKLLSDRAAAKGMAMVCLLVNIGRMNTTLNFFPEMRAQLRTYHAIPSLQAQADSNAYKQLQDAPRLKSILKGGMEDRTEPNSLDAVKAVNVPRTNPVNLLFLICSNATKVAELHFPPGGEFHDLIMKKQFTSESRARAFLWIMWFYLESDFTEEGCEENPFGAGVDYGVDVANQGVPQLVLMSEEEMALENVDTEEEKRFGREKQEMRRKIIEADQQFMAESQTKRGGRARALAGEEVGPSTGILPRIRPSKHESDHDSVRSTPPRALLGRPSVGASTGRRGPHSLKYVVDGSSPGGPQLEGIVARKPRPPTAHQIAVERNRNQRVEYILDRRLRKSYHQARKIRRVDGAIIHALQRLEQLDDEDPWEDSEDEDTVKIHKAAIENAGVNVDTHHFRERGYGGLCQLKNETDDFGEQFHAYTATLRRVSRRLTRWENSDDPNLGVIAPIKRPKATNGTVNGDGSDGEGDQSPSKEPIDPAETEDEAEMMSGRQTKTVRRPKANGLNRGDTNGDTPMEEADDLDDVDRGLLGLGDEDEGDGQGDDDLDDVEKTLLGLDGDSDSE